MNAIDLSDYRWIRAMKRYKRRERQAALVYDMTDDYDLWCRLRHKAMLDYLEEVPELRELRRQSDKIKIGPMV